MEIQIQVKKQLKNYVIANCTNANNPKLIGKDLYLEGKILPLPSQKIWTFKQPRIIQKDGHIFVSGNYVGPTIGNLTFQNNYGIVSTMMSVQIPKLIAQRTFEEFGDRTFSDFQRLADYLKKYLQPSRVEGALQQLSQTGAYASVCTVLSEYGCKLSKIKAITKTYGDDALTFLQEHPYQLYMDNLLPFSIANQLKKNYFLAKDKKQFVLEAYQAYIINVLRQNELRGNMCLEIEKIFYKFHQLMSKSNKKGFVVAMQNLIKTKKISICSVGNKRFVYLNEGKQCEKNIAIAIKRITMNNTPKISGINVETKIEEVQRELNIELAPKQKEAVRAVLNNSISIITGGPGTGKTTVIRVICMVLKKIQPSVSILLTAPTGRAARRMGEATGGLPSSTIHHRLGLGVTDSDALFTEKAKNTITEDVIFVDEMSMLDSFVGEQLFTSIGNSSRLIILGDVNQLESVGPGSLLKDLIQSGCITTIKLDKIYRQTGKNSIVENAEKIKCGKTDLIFNNIDFELVKIRNAQEACKHICNIYLNEIEKQGQSLDDVIILSPLRKNTSFTSVDYLNLQLREIINPKTPEKPEIFIRKKEYRVGDKIMSHINDSNADISNGDIGYITKIISGENGPQVYVDFGKGEFLCSNHTLSSMDLSYATTIHKSQGSEFKTVILCISEESENMLGRHLLYTGITRAKKKVIIVGQESAIKKAILTIPEKRITLQQNWLLKYFSNT